MDSEKCETPNYRQRAGNYTTDHLQEELFCLGKVAVTGWIMLKCVLKNVGFKGIYWILILQDIV